MDNKILSFSAFAGRLILTPSLKEASRDFLRYHIVSVNNAYTGTSLKFEASGGLVKS